jgi:hypothetical protein
MQVKESIEKEGKLCKQKKVDSVSRHNVKKRRKVTPKKVDRVSRQKVEPIRIRKKISKKRTVQKKLNRY